jgi:hypothetical protein
MWSDTLLELERAHLLLLAAWSAMSILIGTALYAWLTARRSPSPLLRHFAIQTSVWGVVVLSFAGLRLHGLAERDFAGAIRLDRMVWLSAGLDGGMILVGMTLACTGWVLGRRLAPVGAGIGVVVQAAGLLLLDVRFLAITGQAV